MRRLSLCLLLAAAGCGSGCDGERLKPPDAPRAPLAHGDAPAADLDAGAAAGLGFLDAPAGTLDPLFASLSAAERQDPSGRALLLFFGDSHTAGDSMTSRLRVTLQSRFGDAGRGLVAAGRPPARHYYQRDVHYGSQGSWRAAIGGTKDPEPFGIAGLRVYGERKGAQLWVETCADCPAGKSVAQFEILYQAAPDRGTLKYKVDDGAWQTLSLRTQPIEPPHPARQLIPVPDGPHKLTLEHAGGGMIDLYGVAMERLRPGVIVDSLGVVGRRLGSLRSWDWSVIGEQLATRDPRLVVLQYGTNEADDPDLDLDATARYYDETIQRIRASAPGASILILGPPDMGVREAGKACDRMKPAARKGSEPIVDAGVIPECEWRTPAVLRDIISVQHAAAARNHVAFFDTFAAMGGGDHMHEWVTGEPKLAYKDHVHLTDLGYQKWADELSGALLAEYGRWKKTQNVAAPVPPPITPPTVNPGPPVHGAGH
ncbi:MAG TPA: GDSL-type esterase/lipase family protein [Kofleriaceae bacterium]|nr:GDSL-type esterase/lipase family protein [Kofleriaceae bacterium]